MAKDDFAAATSILHEVLAEFRIELDGFRQLARATEQSNRELTVAIRELVETLGAPTTRTATLELPDGPATMSIEERR